MSNPVTAVPSRPTIRTAEALADGSFRVAIDNGDAVEHVVVPNRDALVRYARENDLAWAVEDAVVAAPPRAAEPEADRPAAPTEALRPRPTRVRAPSEGPVCSADVGARQQALFRLGLNNDRLKDGTTNTDGIDGPRTRRAHARFFLAGEGAIFSAYWQTLSAAQREVFRRRGMTPDTVATLSVDELAANISKMRFPEPATKDFILGFEIALEGDVTNWELSIPETLSRMATPGAPPAAATGPAADTRPPMAPGTGTGPGMPAPADVPGTPVGPSSPGESPPVAPATPGAPPVVNKDCPDPAVAEARGYLLALTTGNITREHARRIAEAIAKVTAANGPQDEAVTHALSVVQQGLTEMIAGSVAGPSQAVRFLSALDDKALAGNLIGGILTSRVPPLRDGGYRYLDPDWQNAAFVRELLQPESGFVDNRTFLDALYGSIGYTAIKSTIGASPAAADRAALARLIGNLRQRGMGTTAMNGELEKILAAMVNANDHKQAVDVIAGFNRDRGFGAMIAFNVAIEVGAGDWDRDDYLRELLSRDILINDKDFMKSFVADKPGPGAAHEMMRSALIGGGSVTEADQLAYLRFVAKAMQYVPTTSRDLWLDNAADVVAELVDDGEQAKVGPIFNMMAGNGGSSRAAGELMRRSLAKLVVIDDDDTDDFLFLLNGTNASLLNDDDFVRGLAFTDSNDTRVAAEFLRAEGHLEQLVMGWPTAEEKALFRRIAGKIKEVVPEDWQGHITQRVLEVGY